jgi:hypothetical protein
MATLFIVPRSAMPPETEKSFSDTFFLKTLQPHAIAVTFDMDSKEAADMFDGTVAPGKYPALCNRWARRNGVKVSDYFFIVPNDDAKSDTGWPENAMQIMVCWEYVMHYCISPAFEKTQILRYQKEIDRINEKLRDLIY